MPFLNDYVQGWQIPYGNLSDKERLVGASLTHDYQATVNTSSGLVQADASNRHRFKANSDPNNAQYSAGAGNIGYHYGLWTGNSEVSDTNPLPVEISDDELYNTDWQQKINDLVQGRSVGELSKDEIKQAWYYESMWNKKIFATQASERQTDYYGGKIYANVDMSKYLPPAALSVMPTNPQLAEDLLKFSVNALDYKLDTNRVLANSGMFSSQNIQNNSGKTNTVNIKVDGGVHIDTPLDKDFANEIAYGIVDGVSTQWDVTKNMRN